MGFVTSPHPYPMDPYHPGLKPAPIIIVAVRHRDLEGIAFLRAFLDTGADRTILAPHSLQLLERAIGLLPAEFRYVGGRKSPFYDLGFSFDGGERWFYPENLVEYATDLITYPWEEDLIIGRDVLAQFEFCCNGPEESFTLKHPQYCWKH